MPMNKCILVLLVLLLSMAVGVNLINSALSNPYSQARYSGVIGPPAGTNSPKVSFLYQPLNGYRQTDKISLTFKVSAGELRVHSVSYKTDWLKNEIKINSFNLKYVMHKEIEFLLNLNQIPTGNHTVTISATAKGVLYTDYFHYYEYFITGSSQVTFSNVSPNNGSTDPNQAALPDLTINLPAITITNSSNNALYKTGNITFNLDVKPGNLSSAYKQSLKAVYCQADWQTDKTEIPLYSPTVTFTGIPDGRHNVTFYAVEERQYDGYNDYQNGLHYKIFEATGSQSISFIVDTTSSENEVQSPENTSHNSSSGYVVATAGVSVVAGCTILFFFKRRKRS